MASSIRVLAGEQAFSHVNEHGLRQEDISLLLGASGGPKWFVLYGLDCYLAGNFFAKRTETLSLVGSSAGAWRFACLAQQNPVAAIERFASAYSTLCYPKGATIDEVTRISATVLDAIYPSDANVSELVCASHRAVHFIVAKQKTNQAPKLRHLLKAFGSNLLRPSNLLKHYDRVVFSNTQGAQGQALPLFAHVAHQHLALTHANARDALMASGSIPLLMHPITNPSDAPAGVYADGGILDYHISLPLKTEGLVLYPHFYPHLVPGWFDKKLPWRRTPAKALKNTVLLCPSKAWVNSLPYKKIPDRTDFTRLSDAKRIAYWQEVLERSFELAEDFKQGNYVLERL